MTEGAGLSPERYARWLTDTLSATLLLSPGGEVSRGAALRAQKRTLL